MSEFKIGQHNIEIKYSGTGSFSPWHHKAYEEAGIKGLICTADVKYFVKIDDDIYRIEKSNTLLSQFFEEMVKLYETKPFVVEEYLIFLKNNAIDEFYLSKCRPIEECINEIKSK